MENLSQESLSEFINSNSNERNWCVLTEDGIQGPFAAADIKRYYQQKKLMLHHRIWHKKNSSWMHLSSIKHLIEEPKSTNLQRSLMLPLSANETSKENDTIKKLSWLEDVAAVPTLEQKNRISRNPVRARLAFVSGLMVSIGLTIFTFGKRFSLPPNEIQLLKKTDQEKAEALISTSGLFSKAQTEVFLVPDNQFNKFLVISNKSQNQRYRLRAIGKPNTLLQTFRAEFESSFNLNKDLALVSLQPENRMTTLPRGLYSISLECLDCVENSTIPVFQSEMFLGGIQDEYYSASLVQYHSRLRQQAIEELKYIKQIAVAILKINRIKEAQEFQEESQIVTTELESLEKDVKENRYFYFEHVQELKDLLNQSMQIQSNPDAKANFVRKVDDFLGRVEFLLKHAEIEPGFPKKI